MVAHTLKECRKVESHPVKSKVDTVLEARKRVAENLAVARAVGGVVAKGDLVDSAFSFLFVVEIDIPEVTSKESALHTVGADISEGVADV